MAPNRIAAWECLTGFVTAPSTTLTALTMAGNDSLTVRNVPGNAWLLNAWVDAQATGSLQILSPRMHDNQRAITVADVASEVYPLISWMTPQVLFPQDQLTVKLSGSATAGDIETACMLIAYNQLPGLDARLITYDEFIAMSLGQTMVVENTLALGTTGGYSGQEAINAEYDNWKANEDYALVGYETNTECAGIFWTGVDTGNLRVGGPGNETNKEVTREWFLKLAQYTGLNMIPVFNGANKNAIYISGAQDENGADPLVNSIFVQLNKNLVQANPYLTKR